MPQLDIAKINAAAAGWWTAEENEISRLSDADFEKLLGYNPDPASGEMPLSVREALAATAGREIRSGVAAPAAVDLRNVGGKNFITPVRNQLSCGSCVAFGSIATLEGTTRFVNNDPNLAIDLSEGHLFQCIARNQGRNCGNGWWMDPAMTALRDQGVVDEGCSPYSPADQQCTLCAGWQQRLVQIRSYQEIRAVSDMKNWIASKGPLAACFSVYSDFSAYQTGVYRRTPGSTLRGGHCICVVGYDDGQGAWICKNSWGLGWGQAGYFLIAYGECGIDASMWGVVPGASPSPSGTYVPLYRYWNPGVADHFYTTSWAELGGGRYGWGYEGVQCYVAGGPLAGLTPLYRYWNPAIGDHFYTTSWNELGAGRYGWRYEGVQCYVAPGQLPNTLPLYRYWNPQNGDHFYTTSWGELGSGRYGWGYEGIQCYVWRGPSGVSGPDDVPATFRTGSDYPDAAPGLSGLVGPTGGGGEASAPPIAGVGVPNSFRTTDDGGGEEMVPSSFRTAGLESSSVMPSTFRTAAADVATSAPTTSGCGCGKRQR